MRQSTPISYLNFRQQFFFRNAVDWQWWCWIKKKWKKLSISKKLYSSRDNNVQIGNFPIYDKIWIRDVGIKKFLFIITLLIFIPRIFNTFYSLAVFLHSFRAWKIHESLIDLFAVLSLDVLSQQRVKFSSSSSISSS